MHWGPPHKVGREGSAADARRHNPIRNFSCELGSWLLNSVFSELLVGLVSVKRTFCKLRLTAVSLLSHRVAGTKRMELSTQSV